MSDVTFSRSQQQPRDIIAAVEQVENGSGVIVLTDMFGGTPSNLAISVMEPGRIDVWTASRHDDPSASGESRRNQ